MDINIVKENFILNPGQVIRICHNNDCKKIYVAHEKHQMVFKTCKFCGINNTGFFETVEMFTDYVNMYNINIDNADAELRKHVKLTLLKS